MHKRSLIKPSFFLAGILAALITSGAWAANESPSKTDPAKTAAVERNFQAVIISADPANHTIRVRHKPTGYETDVVWDTKSSIIVSKTLDVDDLPEGWVLCRVREVHPARKAIFRIRGIEPLDKSNVPAKADEVKANSGVRCKLVRLPVTPEILKNHNQLLTRDKKRAYALEANGETWALEVLYQMRPKLGRNIDGTGNDLMPGMLCKDLVYREDAGRNRLISVLLAAPKKNTIGDWTPTGPSGTKVEELETAMATLRATHQRLALALRRLMPVRFKLSPEITLPGEPVTLTIEAWASKTPNPVVTLNISYLQPDVAQKKELSLQWKAGESADGLTKYTTAIDLPRLPVGQHYLTWTCDIGGDIPEFWRSFAVADSNTLVTMFHQTPGKIVPDYDELRLPYDHWELKVSGLLNRTLTGKFVPASAKANDFAALSVEYRRRGSIPAQPLTCMTKDRATLPYPVHFSDEPESLQRAYFQTMLELNGYCGFDPKDVGFIGYEIGTKSLNVAKQAGVRLISSLCSHQNWMDGSGAGKINLQGRPLRPYFAAADDFRKAGRAKGNPLVLVSQMDVMEPICGFLVEKGWQEARTPGLWDDLMMSRQFDDFNAYIEGRVNQKVPLFLSLGMEFSAFANLGKCNAQMLHYATKRAKDGKIVFCNQAAAADFYRRHFTEIPETIGYISSSGIALYFMPFMPGPVDGPDVIQFENARCSAYFQKTSALPEYHWDYTKPWNYPDWGNEEIPRDEGGCLVPGEYDRFAVTPKITDTRKMKVSQSLSENADGLEIVVTLETAEAIKSFPLVLWDLPREWKAGEGWWKVTGANRFVPIRAPYTGNLNGILEVDAQPGKNEYRLTITTPNRTPASQDILLKTMYAKVFSRDGQSMAYIWPMQPWETSFELTVPEGKSVQYYATPKGERVDLTPGTHRLTINKESWSRIVGLTKNELDLALKE